MIVAYYPEVPMLEVPKTRPGSSLGNWIKKHSPEVPVQRNDDVDAKVGNDYDMDIADTEQVKLFSSVEIFSVLLCKTQLKQIENK